MNVTKFFEDNPKAEFIMQVGERHFLKHAETQAKYYARVSGNKLKKIYNPSLKQESTTTKNTAPTKKELQAQAEKLGIEFKVKTTVSELKELIANKKVADKEAADKKDKKTTEGNTSESSTNEDKGADDKKDKTTEDKTDKKDTDKKDTTSTTKK